MLKYPIDFSLFSLIIATNNTSLYYEFLRYIRRRVESGYSEAYFNGISIGLFKFFDEKIFNENIDDEELVEISLKILEEFLKFSKNYNIDFIKISLERSFLLEIIDKLRMSSNDNIASLSNSVIEEYF